MVRYTDHLNNDVMVRSLIQGAIATIKRAVKKKGANDIDVSYLKKYINYLVFCKGLINLAQIHKKEWEEKVYNESFRTEISPKRANYDAFFLF